MKVKAEYEVIIVGAGPAGLSAGRALLKGKCNDVLLIDKIAPWEHPIPCAEGVGKLGFSEAGTVLPSWIRQEITTATFHAPGGGEISYTDKNGGYIINRSLMQHDIAIELICGGITGLFSFRVSEIERASEERWSVIGADGSIFRARVVIDASGPVNCFGKNERIAAKPADLEPAYFVWVEECDIPTDRVHIYAGQKTAPGGYAWVFPRDKGQANIGIVIGRAHLGSVNLREILDDFLKKHYPSVRIVKRFAGSIPCGGRSSLPMAIPGFIKAGDAASTVNPISRAGISEAMLSGKLAGEAALAMLEAGTKKEQKAAVEMYQKTWNQMRGSRHRKLAKVKDALLSVPDEDYDRGAEVLAAIPQAEMTMSRIFRASLGRFPRLVWAMRHLM